MRSVASSAWGLPGDIWSHSSGPRSSSSPSTVKRSLSRQNLDHGGAAGLMLTEPRSSVEAEHGHIELVITVDDLGDHRARLEGDLVGGRKSEVGHMSSFMFRLSMLDWPARGRGDQKSLSPTGPKAFPAL